MNGTSEKAASPVVAAEAAEAPAPAAPKENGTAASDEATTGGKDLTSKDYYFDSYSHHGIHEEMLKDEVRTLSYMRAIVQNKHLFKDKVVLDVGCGTGILSMFAAKAGAKKVYAVDFSGIAEQAKKIVAANGHSDVVEVIRGKVEEVELDCGPGGVDVIISEWMGYFLLYESMLDSVLVARDKWLRPGGVLLPDKAKMYVVGIEDAQYKEEKLGYWENVYGFDMSVMKEMAIIEPLVDTVDKESVMTAPRLIKTFDINTMKQSDVDFNAKFQLEAIRDDYCNALTFWFDVSFDACHVPVKFSTGPHVTPTHWKQTHAMLKDDLTVKQGEKIDCEVDVKQNKGNKRDLDITISYKFKGELDQASNTQLFRLR